MLTNVLFAAAGISELSPEGGRELGLKLVMLMASPFILYCVCVVVLLAFLLWTPERRQRWKWRSLLAFMAALTALGLVLLIPARFFVGPLSLWW
jgi:hypothetical protein